MLTGVVRVDWNCGPQPSSSEATQLNDPQDPVYTLTLVSTLSMQELIVISPVVGDVNMYQSAWTAAAPKQPPEEAPFPLIGPSAEWVPSTMRRAVPQVSPWALDSWIEEKRAKAPRRHNWIR